jgi:hypothetical protein
LSTEVADSGLVNLSNNHDVAMIESISDSKISIIPSKIDEFQKGTKFFYYQQILADYFHTINNFLELKI